MTHISPSYTIHFNSLTVRLSPVDLAARALRIKEERWKIPEKIPII